MKLSEKSKSIIIENLKSLAVLIVIFAIFTIIVAIGRATTNDYSRLTERHGDLKIKNYTNEIDIIDRFDYHTLKFEAISKEDRLSIEMGHYTELEAFSEINTYIDDNYENSTTLYSLIVQYERPHMLEAVNECKKTNDIELCYSALNEYDKLYADGVVELISYKMFVENAVYTSEQEKEELRIELELREKEEARILDEKRRTKLYSCVETGDNLTCTKVKD